MGGRGVRGQKVGIWGQTYTTPLHSSIPDLCDLNPMTLGLYLHTHTHAYTRTYTQTHTYSEWAVSSVERVDKGSCLVCLGAHVLTQDSSQWNKTNLLTIFSVFDPGGVNSRVREGERERERERKIHKGQ